MNSTENPLRSQISALSDRTRDASDQARQAESVLTDHSVATVMGRIETSGMTEGTVLLPLEADSILEALLNGVSEAQQQAIKARLSQLGAQMTAQASKAAVQSTEQEVRTQLAQPATQASEKQSCQ